MGMSHIIKIRLSSNVNSGQGFELGETNLNVEALLINSKKRLSYYYEKLRMVSVSEGYRDIHAVFLSITLLFHQENHIENRHVRCPASENR